MDIEKSETQEPEDEKPCAFPLSTHRLPLFSTLAFHLWTQI